MHSYDDGKEGGNITFLVYLSVMLTLIFTIHSSFILQIKTFLSERDHCWVKLQTLHANLWLHPRMPLNLCPDNKMDFNSRCWKCFLQFLADNLLLLVSSPIHTLPIIHIGFLLAPTGALVLMMVYDIYIYPPTFSDFEHLCLSILLQVSL